MKEEFLQYIWANALYRNHEMLTCSGKKIKILYVGQQNRDAGADFFNARIYIDGIEFAGNIEIHLRNSDWNRHGHHVDPVYNNVLLSVVKEVDTRIYNSMGNEVETVVLDYVDSLYEEYLFMQKNGSQPGCRRNLEKIDKERFYMNLQNLAVERLERKCCDLRKILDQTQNDWQECFYRLLCKYWAGNVNAEPFYQLTLLLPYKLLLRHADKPEILEALLFGCSGLLSEAPEDDYVIKLKKEFEYLRAKYQLDSLVPEQWKFMRIRPDAFPTVRMALLAAFFSKSANLVGKITDAGTLQEVMELLDVTASKYWDSHYCFERASQLCRPKRMGRSLKKIIIINTIVPFLFLYGKEQDKETYCDKAIDWLENLEAEDNYIITDWKDCGFHFDSALQTQALIQLRKEYCDKHRCLECKVGREVLKKINT